MNYYNIIQITINIIILLHVLRCKSSASEDFSTHGNNKKKNFINPYIPSPNTSYIKSDELIIDL